MTIGASILLIVIGAILKFAMNVEVAQVSLDTVGIILMIAGGVGLILGFVQEGMARQARREGQMQARRAQTQALEAETRALEAETQALEAQRRAGGEVRPEERGEPPPY